MRDEISKERVWQLHPAVRQEAIDAIDAAEAGFPPTIKVRVAQALRSIAYQNKLFAQGRTEPGEIITKARGGLSYHNYGLAVDYVLRYDKNGDGNFEELSWDIIKDGDSDGLKDWDEVRMQFEIRGWKWGGKNRTFKDYPHVEKSFGYTTKQLLAKYNKKEFIPGTEYVLISNNL